MPGTLEETNCIAKLLKKGNIKVSVYKGNNANEESFKALSGKDISILHITTHSYYLNLSEEDENKYLNYLKGFTERDKMMYCSGLLFADSNNTWQGKTVSDTEYGILTSAELSRLYFSKTKIDVLYTCKFGIGDTNHIDGV